jgi:hypothetical protein
MSRRYFLLSVVIVIIAFWAFLSWYIWSGVASADIKGILVYKIVSLPVGLMSWPAHEICLIISGVDYGANASSPASFWYFMVFLVQAVLTWSLLLVPVVMQKKIYPWIFFQSGLLLLLFLTFWLFGNG